MVASRLIGRIALATLSLITGCAVTAPYTAQVVGVSDGDSLTALAGGTQIKIRLHEIDAPELRQPYGQRSRQSLADLCFQRQAVIDPVTRDRYGRTVARVACAGTDAASHQVGAGMAWVFDRYADPHSPLYGLQRAAKAARLGLWGDATPTPPWEWRRPQR